MNQRELYIGWMRAKKIYGQNPVHVQLVAKQTNYTVGEVVDYILDNPTLVTTQEYAPSSGFTNQLMGNEYAGMYISSVSKIAFLTTESIILEGNSSITVTVDIENDTFKSSTSTGNWTIDAGVTGLTLASVSSGTTSKTLTFTGTAVRGTLKITCKATGLDGGVISDTLSIDVVAKSLDYTTLQTVMPEVGAPIAAVAASATLTSNNTEIADGDTVTIGTVVYRFKDTPAQANDVKRHGTTADTTLGNLVKAVNLSGEGDGSDYHEDTVIHPDVSAGSVAAHAITFTAKVKGAAGNLIAKAVSAGAEELDWDGTGAYFTNGVDGTPAKPGKIFLGTDKMVVAKAECYIYNTDGYVDISYDT